MLQWYYSGDHALDLIEKQHLHPWYRGKLTKHRFGEDERIASDHLDFVSVEAYAGKATGIVTFLRLKGLKVTDKDRLRPPAQRAKREEDDGVEIVVRIRALHVQRALLTPRHTGLEQETQRQYRATQQDKGGCSQYF